jgi:hypothetical protein
MRSAADMDAEIARKFEVLASDSKPHGQKTKITFSKRRIIRRGLKNYCAEKQLKGGACQCIQKRAKAAGRTPEEVKRDILCSYLGIRQVVE